MCLSQEYASSLVIGLNMLYEDKHQYVTVMCRVFQILHPKPLSYRLSVYVTKLRHTLNHLVKKNLAVGRLTKGRRNLGSPSVKQFRFGVNKIREALFGGLIYLPDAQNLLRQIFSGAPEMS